MYGSNFVLLTRPCTASCRQKYGIRRGVDGRVQLRSRSGQWYSIRLDMEVPGALLLRDPKGNVYAIETQDLPQVGGRLWFS
jgi:hypothetical protein